MEFLFVTIVCFIFLFIPLCILIKFGDLKHWSVSVLLFLFSLGLSYLGNLTDCWSAGMIGACEARFPILYPDIGDAVFVPLAGCLYFTLILYVLYRKYRNKTFKEYLIWASVIIVWTVPFMFLVNIYNGYNAYSICKQSVIPGEPLKERQCSLWSEVF